MAKLSRNQKIYISIGILGLVAAFYPIVKDLVIDKLYPKDDEKSIVTVQQKFNNFEQADEKMNDLPSSISSKASSNLKNTIIHKKTLPNATSTIKGFREVIFYCRCPDKTWEINIISDDGTNTEYFELPIYLDEKEPTKNSKNVIVLSFPINHLYKVALRSRGFKKENSLQLELLAGTAPKPFPIYICPPLTDNEIIMEMMNH